MNDAQSTIVGLKSQDCPGGGWTGMPAELEGRATVADCLADGSCGCIYGGAAQHIERLLKIEKAARRFVQEADDYPRYAPVKVWATPGADPYLKLKAALGNQQNNGETK